MRRWGLIVLVMLCQALACESVQDPADAVGLAPDAHEDDVAEVWPEAWPDAVEPPFSPGAAFAAPEGVAVIGDLVLVANTAFGYEGTQMTFGTGFVTVLDRQTLTVINHIPTSAKNPQAIVVGPDRAFVVCSGESTFDALSGLVQPGTPGAIDEILLATARTATAVTRSIPIPRSDVHPLVGLPKSLVPLSDGRAYLGSSSSAAVLVVDLENMTLLRGADDPIALGDLSAQDGIMLIATPSGHVIAASFNQDRLMAIDPVTDALAGGAWEPVEAGQVPGAMEGICDLALQTAPDPTLYVLFCIGNTVSRIRINDGFGAETPVFATTGLWPNRIALWDDHLLILNSGDNNVTGVRLSDGSMLGQVVTLPAASNPYDLVVGPDHVTAYVSGLMSHSLFAIDLVEGGFAEVR